MAKWNLKYETGFILPSREKNYFLKTINDFLELNQVEQQNLTKILQKLKEVQKNDKNQNLLYQKP